MCFRLDRISKFHSINPYTAGGEIPVQLIYDDENEEELRDVRENEEKAKPLPGREIRSNSEQGTEKIVEKEEEITKDNASNEEVKESTKEVEKEAESLTEKETESPTSVVEKELEEPESAEATEMNHLPTAIPVKVANSVEPTAVKPSISRSRLLNIGIRESDDNSKYGLGIQSRNKNTPAADGDSYIYNISPYQGNDYPHINIEDYINKLKNEKLNKKKPAVVEEPPKQVEDDDESDVIDAEEPGYIRRRIQHYETIIKPSNQFQGLMQPYSQFMGENNFPGYPLMNGMYYTQPQNYNMAPTVLFLPSSDLTRNQNLQRKPFGSRILDSYFPFVINNPFNEIWSGITNIVEYGPEADVCRKSNKKARRRESHNAPTEIEITSPRSSDSGANFPQITRMKVRRGGVAIAGPGGIATAGSGGTAIVGPGGTAYTTRRGTAVVGPGGKVVHVPQFPVFNSGDKSEPRNFEMDLEGEVVARGPVVYYDDSWN